MDKYFCCIGATNLDLRGSASYPLICGDSTVGKVSETVGGVGHNIATNLSHLVEGGVFITSVGNDGFSTIIERDLDNNTALKVIKSRVEHSSGLYLYIENENGEMINAVNDMGINALLTPAFLSQHEKLIHDAEFVIIDTNISQEAIEYICSLNSNIITDPVSCKKSEKLQNVLSRLRLLKPNEIELEAMTNIKIECDEDIVKASHLLLDKGVQCVITTRGEKGAVYVDKNTTLFVENPPNINIVNTTGAGDAFTAGVCFALFNNLPPLDIIKSAIGCSLLTLQSEHPISEKLNYKNLKEVLDESIFRYRT